MAKAIAEEPLTHPPPPGGRGPEGRRPIPVGLGCHWWAFCAMQGHHCHPGKVTRATRRDGEPASGPHPGTAPGKVGGPTSPRTTIASGSGDEGAGGREHAGHADRGCVREIDQLFRIGTLAGLTDGQLLDRFVAGPEGAAEASFAALIERHGAMVLAPCHRELGNPHDAEDAAQVAFVALARRRPVDPPPRVGRELAAGRRASRVARRAAGGDRRRQRERVAARPPVAAPR